MIKKIIHSLFVIMLLTIMLPFVASCGNGVDSWAVQVWQPSAGGEPETLLAFGVVVDDGNHVLTVLDYEEYTPDGLLVVSSKNGQFEATVQSVDYRTSATLLKLQGADLPVAEIGDSSSLESEQQVYAGGWGGRNDEYMKTPLNAYSTEDISPLFFSVSLTQEVLDEGKGLVGQPGAAITDSNGIVIGLLGRYWSKLVTHLGGPLDQYPPLAVSIDSAMELLTDESHASGPAIVVVMDGGSSTETIPGSYPHLPLNVLEGLDSIVIELLDELGDSLTIDDLVEHNHQFSCREDGKLLVVTFPYLLDLQDSSGNLLADAKWVGIHWDRSEGKPNRLLYGSTSYVVEGAYCIEDDLDNLIQILQPVL